MKRHMHRYLFRRLPFVALLVLAAAFSVWLAAGADQAQLPRQDLTIQTQTGPRGFLVEVAATPEQQATGLMNRRHLADDQGMLFWFGAPERVVSFWMKNTLIPLDMIFIGADGRVRGVHANAEPGSLQSISSQDAIVATLEIPGGQAAAQGIAAGDSVAFPGLPIADPAP